ncbi:MAG: hypothetical protein BRC40_01385 [Cyanobacteria bacterium QH_8_48_120]|jgi:hypothetical protein|nr:MAG: hypothetical protein BRC34_05180 [Cyanobacteria bacterium QH_1_48_107]PSO56126.1 MAG: hypothetical protein BRC35_10000 [Cyanobacteria bacterium QH_10_48_56]PSO61162.1 MAG: hypothetical protein BRC39_08405 [Cyanobacteria bacterium QH_7_48_89]PSO66210.1 MAG: hypothetical protein BRC38_06435 [Cyanobacteria bacterium QH_6_48_35]PSO66389.1 MAG: hypothetical protein BRC36_01405 [Cyanobacteria bacterium QH_2_48_84]PSO68542.1 MAG: hypothetical protein BRC42_13370 [Cyanobacteria bacterium QS_1_
MSIEKLQPATQADVSVYAPYCHGNKRNLLPLAISLYQKGYLEGERQIEESESIPFVASWYVSKLPAELTRCRLQFNGNAELNYEVSMANSEFVNYLTEVIKKFKHSRSADFPKEFYQKLLKMDNY